MVETARAVDYSERLMSVAIDVAATAKVELNENLVRDPKIVALTILCRSISNFRAALILAQKRHVMEARALIRGLYENLLWIGALHQRGLDFVQDMLKD